MHQFWCIGNYEGNVEHQEKTVVVAKASAARQTIPWKNGAFSAAKNVQNHRSALEPSRAVYFSALNPEHCPASGGLVLFPTFKSARITPLSVEQNSRLPVRSKTSGAAAVR